MNFLMGRGVEDKIAYYEYIGVFEYIRSLYLERRHEYRIMLPTKTHGVGYYWNYYDNIKDRFKEKYPSGTTENGLTVYELCTLEYRSKVIYALSGIKYEKEKLTKYRLRKAKKSFDARFEALGYMLAVAYGCSDTYAEGPTKRPDMNIVYELLEATKKDIETKLDKNITVNVTVDQVDRVIYRLRDVIDSRGLDVLPNEIRADENKWDESIWTDKYVELLELPKIFDIID